jgi:hypothetical protein
MTRTGLKVHVKVHDGLKEFGGIKVMVAERGMVGYRA